MTTRQERAAARDLLVQARTLVAKRHTRGTMAVGPRGRGPGGRTPTTWSSPHAIGFCSGGGLMRAQYDLGSPLEAVRLAVKTLICAAGLTWVNPDSEGVRVRPELCLAYHLLGPSNMGRIAIWHDHAKHKEILHAFDQAILSLVDRPQPEKTSHELDLEALDVKVAEAEFDCDMARLSRLLAGESVPV